MEAITHILTGMLTQLFCFIIFPFPLNIILTIIIGFFSHYLIDTLAKITYHTPEPHKEDKFWVAWHIVTPALCVVLLIWNIVIGLFWFFLLGAISANLVDIWDWMILRPIQSKKKKVDPETNWGQGYFIHPQIDWFRDKAFGWAPNLNYEKKGVIPEIITIIILWISVLLLISILN